MSRITKEDFNKDMDAYVQRRLGDKKTLLSRVLGNEFSKSKPQMQQNTKQNYSIDPKTGKSLDPQFQTTRSTNMGDYQDIRSMNTDGVSNVSEKDFEQEEGQFEEKPSILMRIFSFFSSSEQEESVVEQEEVLIQPQESVYDNQELKEVLKITVRWLKLLDPQNITKIKQSEDFAKYKKVLKKYGLIK